ncbi:MAG: dihydrolipoyl dehydrogenase [Acidobacteria bacterium]|nr:dihydrolipoyl dehydrogenase [Acidobacteriota bacterium]
MPESFDLVVLGGGTGGYAAALRAAQLGMSVALVERDLVGGTCLHRGCIPTKALLHAAEVHDGARDAGRFGVRTGEVTFDWAGVQKHKERVVQKMHRGLESLMKNRAIEVVRAPGELRSPGTIAAGGRELRGGKVVVATGSRPKLLPGLAVGPRVITSDEALALDRVPASAIVIGAGSVGVEFASLWASFGSKVTVVEMLPTLVPLEDADLGKELQRAFSKRGIASLAGAKVEEVHPGETSVRATVTTDGKTQTLEAEILLCAVGRGPVTQGTGLEAAGVTTDARGYVTVDESCRTSAKDVYGVGDLIATPQLAHVAFAEGMLAAEHAAGRPVRPIDYDAIPRCTYSTPEVAAVGLTEAQARERGHDVVAKTVGFAGIGKAAALGETGGFCKIVAANDGPVLGVHLVGPRVTELVAEGMLAVGWQAAPGEIAALIHPHPTLSEAFGETALALAGRALHTM